MKNKHFLVFIFSIVVFSANALLENTTNIQKKTVLTIKGVFDGFEDEDGYVFIIKSDNDENEELMFFTSVSEDVLKEINLKSDNLVGKSFEITYEVTEYEEEDEEGYTETYEKYTIVKLKKL